MKDHVVRTDRRPTSLIAHASDSPPIRLVDDAKDERAFEAQLTRQKMVEQKQLERTFSRDPHTGSTRFQDSPRCHATYSEVLQVVDAVFIEPIELAKPVVIDCGTFVAGGDDETDPTRSIQPSL